MRNLIKFTVAAAVLAAAVPAAPALAGVQLGDLVKKVADKDKKTEPAKTERKKSPAKVDNFIDENNDGVDDRKVRRVVKPEESKPKAAERRVRKSREAKPAAPKEVKEDSAVTPPRKPR